ncbi:MAG TPA: hypothetical protein VEK76_09935 [Candidatus Binatia bacterium]|nr:hypothetical protein [Candidatus Binatia bacterium]
MTARQPAGGGPEEDELLKQWAFLDRLVERQAAQLRAGIQDAEEADEGLTELQGLHRELEAARGELSQAQAAHRAAVAEARRARAQLSALAAAHQQVLDDRDALRQRLDGLDGEMARWRTRGDGLEAELQRLELRSRGQLQEVMARLSEAEAQRQSSERGRLEVLESLRAAHLEVEQLRARIAASRRGLWHFRRRPGG